MSYLKILKIKKSNLKKERIPSSTKEKTVSTEQYETTQRYPHLATRPFITRPTLIAGRCATSHDTERFRVFVWHVFATTDIERTFCQYARGCALLGCDIDTFSPLLTSTTHGVAQYCTGPRDSARRCSTLHGTGRLCKTRQARKQAFFALPHDGTDSMILRDLARRIAIIEHTVDCTALPTTPRDSAKHD